MSEPAQKPNFASCSPRTWSGRYSRVVGGTVWKVRNTDRGLWPLVEWSRDDTTLDCLAAQESAAKQLANAVVEGKRWLGGSGTGSFLINEFGQVIVPSSDGDGRRAIVGELEGELLLENPLSESSKDRWISLFEVDDLSPGDAWPWPYLGAQYNLNKWTKIYYYNQNDSGGTSEYPPIQDEDLIRALRTIRRSGPVRFVVTQHGIVLTKRPAGAAWQPEEGWEQVFVGRINRNKWFRKED